MSRDIRLKSSAIKFNPVGDDKNFTDTHVAVVDAEKAAQKKLSNFLRFKCVIKKLINGLYEFTAGEEISRLRLIESMQIYAAKTDDPEDQNFIYFTIQSIALKQKESKIIINGSINTLSTEREIEQVYNFIGVKSSTAHYKSKKQAVKWFCSNELDFKDKSSKNNYRFPDIIRKVFRNMPYELEVEGEELDDEQDEAVRAAMNNVFTVIDGPPGTGKTYVMTRVVKKIEDKWMSERDEEQRMQYKTMIVCSQNATADNALLKMLGSFPNKYQVMRLNSKHQKLVMNSNGMQKYCIEKTIENDVLLEDGLFGEEEYSKYRQLKDEKVAAELEYFWYSDHEGEVDTDKMDTEIARQKWAKYDEEMDKYIDHLRYLFIQQNVSVVVATFASMRNLSYKLKFKLVVVDESCFATQQDIMQAAVLVDAEFGKMVLLGDIQQLEPFYLADCNRDRVSTIVDGSRQLMPKKENMSINELLIKSYKYPNVKTLHIQHRCVHTIAELMSKLCYHNKVKTHDSVISDKNRFRMIGSGSNIVIITHKGLETKVGFEANHPMKNSPSFINITEANIVQKLLKYLPEWVENCNGEKPEDLLENTVVLSFYALQKFLLTNYNLPVHSSTVHSYQGKEAKVVIISAVRQNRNINIGFLEDYHLLNTAISRARDILIIIVGDMFYKLDQHGSAWGHLFSIIENMKVDWLLAEEKNGILSIDYDY